MEKYLTPCQGKSIHAALEKQLIQNYLLEKGYQREDIKKTSILKYRKLMAAASRYASLKLAEIEARSRFLKKIDFQP